MHARLNPCSSTRAVRLATLSLMVAIGCQSTPPKETTRRDNVGPPDRMRIVSVGATTTEVLVALGLADAIVAIDVTSSSVPGAEGKPVVGFYAGLSAEGILGQNPTHILGISTAGPKAVLEQLSAAGVAISLHAPPETVDAARAFISALGEGTGTSALAGALLTDLNTDLVALDALRTPPERRLRAMFLYARGTRTLMVAGKNSPAHEMLRLAGAENALDHVDGFVPLTAEAVIKAAPEVIVVPEKGAKSVGGTDGVVGLPGIAQTPAGQHRRVVTMDDLALLSFGPKLGTSAQELHRRLASAAAP